MEKRYLFEYVNFVQGINQSRAKKQFGDQEVNYYSQDSFDADYKHYEESYQEMKTNTLFDINVSVDKRDVVISNSLQKAAMVGRINVGKILSQNFTKVEFKSDELDKRYFLYLFNENKEVQRQKERGLQGTGQLQKLTRQSLEQIVIPFVSLSEQQRIGEIYIEKLKLQSSLCVYSNLLEQFTSSILEKSLEGIIK